MWLNDYSTGPQLTCPGTYVSNGRGARHAWSLGRVRVQFSGAHDLHTMFLPVQFVASIGAVL